MWISCNIGKSTKNPCRIFATFFLLYSFFACFYTTYPNPLPSQSLSQSFYLSQSLSLSSFYSCPLFFSVSLLLSFSIFISFSFSRNLYKYFFWLSQTTSYCLFFLSLSLPPLSLSRAFITLSFTSVFTFIIHFICLNFTFSF